MEIRHSFLLETSTAKPTPKPHSLDHLTSSVCCPLQRLVSHCVLLLAALSPHDIAGTVFPGKYRILVAEHMDPDIFDIDPYLCRRACMVAVQLLLIELLQAPCQVVDRFYLQTLFRRV